MVRAIDIEGTLSSDWRHSFDSPFQYNFLLILIVSIAAWFLLKSWMQFFMLYKDTQSSKLSLFPLYLFILFWYFILLPSSLQYYWLQFRQPKLHTDCLGIEFSESPWKAQVNITLHLASCILSVLKSGFLTTSWQVLELKIWPIAFVDTPCWRALSSYSSMPPRSSDPLDPQTPSILRPPRSSDPLDPQIPSILRPQSQLQRPRRLRCGSSSGICRVHAVPWSPRVWFLLFSMLMFSAYLETISGHLEQNWLLKA